MRKKLKKRAAYLNSNKDKDFPSDKIEAMAEAFGVSPAYLMGWDDNIYPVPKSKENIRIKVYGSVPAGVQIESVEDVVDFIYFEMFNIVT